MELTKYNIDIAVLSETRFPVSGSLNALEYTFYWSGKPSGERREDGVGFAINLQYKENIQSERSYETRQAEHNQTEKHQPRGESGAGNGQYSPYSVLGLGGRAHLLLRYSQFYHIFTMFPHIITLFYHVFTLFVYVWVTERDI